MAKKIRRRAIQKIKDREEAKVRNEFIQMMDNSEQFERVEQVTGQRLYPYQKALLKQLLRTPEGERGDLVMMRGRGR